MDKNFEFNFDNHSVVIYSKDLVCAFQEFCQIVSPAGGLLDFTVNNGAETSFTLCVQISKPGFNSDGQRVCGIVSYFNIIDVKTGTQIFELVLPQEQFRYMMNEFIRRVNGA